ncbi:MAG: serine--tRNA ligase, partial [Nitrososphaeraceae archaeon]
MLDLKILKENPQIIKDMLEKRKLNFPINELIAFDKRRRELIAEMQQIKHKKNTISNCIALKKKNNVDMTAELEEMKAIGREILSLEEEKTTVESKFKDLMMMLPNLVDKSVPIGNDETDNLVIKQKEIDKKLRFKPR